MANLQEIARLVREELLTLIRPVQLLSVNPSKGSGEVSGRFRSNGVLFDYSIGGGTVRYRPVGAGGGDRSDAADQEVWAGPRLDAARGKPRNCTTGYACGATCIQKGKTCKAKAGAAAEKVTAIVRYAGGGETEPSAEKPASKSKAAAAKESSGGEAKAQADGGKGPGLKEARSAVMGYFGAKSMKELKASDEFKMSMEGDDNPLKSKEDWLKLYRRFVGVPKNERNLPDGPTVINGIDVIKNFRPWAVFGLDPKTATADDIRSSFRKLIKKHHPDQGGDPQVAERLKKMRDSMLALRPDARKPTKSRRDSAEPSLPDLLQQLTLSRLALRNRWSSARADGYRDVAEITDRLDARRKGKGKKNCSKGYGCGSSCIEISKGCAKPAGGAAKQLGAMVGGQASQRESRVASQAERRIAAKVARRELIGRELVAQLSRQRPDGMGNYIENPDAAVMQRIKAAGRRVAKLDRELNELEGKDPGMKRWVEGDPYDLKRFSDFQSPGRRAYEQAVIALELKGAERGDQAVFMSGGPASGKTSLLKRQFGEAKGFAVIDPDRIKAYDPVMEIGVAMGMRQAAALAHENSSRLAKEIYAVARDQKLNILIDGTGANAERYINQIQELKGKGYQVTLLAQHVPEEVGVERAVKRANRTGRFVPLHVIQHSYEAIPGNFERLAQIADRATLNDGESNQVIMEYTAGRLAGGDKRRTADYRRRYGKPKG